MIGAVAALGPASAQAALAQPLPVIVYAPCSASALAADISAAVNGETLYLQHGCTYELTGALPDITVRLTIASAHRPPHHRERRRHPRAQFRIGLLHPHRERRR